MSETQSLFQKFQKAIGKAVVAVFGKTEEITELDFESKTEEITKTIAGEKKEVKVSWDIPSDSNSFIQYFWYLISQNESEIIELIKAGISTVNELQAKLENTPVKWNSSLDRFFRIVEPVSDAIRNSADRQLALKNLLSHWTPENLRKLQDSISAFSLKNLNLFAIDYLIKNDSKKEYTIGEKKFKLYPLERLALRTVSGMELKDVDFETLKSIKDSAVVPEPKTTKKSAVEETVVDLSVFGIEETTETTEETTKETTEEKPSK